MAQGSGGGQGGSTGIRRRHCGSWYDAVCVVVCVAVCAAMQLWVVLQCDAVCVEEGAQEFSDDTAAAGRMLCVLQCVLQCVLLCVLQYVSKR